MSAVVRVIIIIFCISFFIKESNLSAMGSVSSPNCCICLSELLEGDVSAAPCGHLFHAECIDQVLESAHGRQPRCPQCRGEITRSALYTLPARIFCVIGSQLVPESAGHLPHGAAAAGSVCHVEGVDEAGPSNPPAQKSLCGAVAGDSERLPAARYRRAAEQGSAGGQRRLGTCYYRGQGVVQDHSQAVEWYRRAAEQGDAVAQFNLGVCYAQGQGVVQDHGQAVEWYRRAAEQENASAQYNLGVCYFRGQGVAQDHGQVAEWFRRAADQGEAVALDALRRLNIIR